MAKSVVRLYKLFKPDNYTLFLHPDRDKMRFSGTVEITGRKFGAPSNRITLHQKGLKISSAEIVRLDKRAGDEVINVKRINCHTKADEVRLHADQKLFPGRYKLSLKFSGKITEQMHGVYPCRFKFKGKDKQLIATQFESHYAREVFPCIDEPEAKATFDLSLKTPTGETVLANTPVREQIEEDGNFISLFETTPKMSTYLLAFAYGELAHRETKTRRGTVVRTYATPGNVAFTGFALDVAKDCLEFYESYFGINYPLPKLDMIALPDFSSGAMENWGLVTYREQAMLVDPKNTPIEAKQYVAMVIAHELAHQWFGNLVTMRWWTDLWLNEGFASWIEYLAVDKLFPNWHMWTQFIVEDQLAGLRADSLNNTHPVEVAIGHPDEIRTIFDDISYQKGASVIHMLQAYLGAEEFRQGLSHYLKKHSYANAETADLWKALEETSGKKVGDFMRNWISEPGYPLVKIEVKNQAISFSQQRFLATGPAKTQSSIVWQVPLNSSDAQVPEVLAAKSMAVQIKQPRVPLVNQGHSGFYSTIYSPASYPSLEEMISAKQISEADRLGLINDAFASAKAGYLSTADVLKMLSAYANEDSSPVWDSLSILLSDIRRVFDDESLHEAMKPYVRQLTTRQLKRLGWQSKKAESHFDLLLRPTILGLSSWAQNDEVVAEALKRFKAMKKPEDAHPDLRSVIYFTAARCGGKPEFDKLLRFYESTQTASEKVTLAGAICSFKQPELFKRAIALIKSDSVRSQDISYWVSYNFANRHAKEETWLWLKRNWDWLAAKLGMELSFARMPLYAARAFSNAAYKKDYQKFFETRLESAFRREYKKGLETIGWQADWRKRDFDSVLAFFNDFK